MFNRFTVEAVNVEAIFGSEVVKIPEYGFNSLYRSSYDDIFMKLDLIENLESILHRFFQELRTPFNLKMNEKWTGPALSDTSPKTKFVKPWRIIGGTYINQPRSMTERYSLSETCGGVRWGVVIRLKKSSNRASFPLLPRC